MSRLIRAGDALSQFFNVIIFDGDSNYSISGDAYRLKRERLRQFIDGLASPWEADHCKASYENDVEKAAKLLEDARP